MVLDLWQYHEGTWPGFMLVVDMDGVTFSHLARLDLQIVQQFVHYVQVGIACFRPFKKSYLSWYYDDDIYHTHKIVTRALSSASR